MNVLFINVNILCHNLTTKDEKIVNQILDERKKVITKITHKHNDSIDKISTEFTGLTADLFSLIRTLNTNGFITELRSIDKTKPVELIIKK